MEKFVIQGGCKLSGSISVGGSKNAVLPMMAACLLAEGKSTILNAPHLRDIKTMSDVLRVIGAKVTGKEHVLVLDTSACDHFEAPYELVKTMRASIYVLGPLLARHGRCRVSLPGGCAWGPRPVDLHIRGMKMLGADVDIRHGYIEAAARRLKGADIHLDVASVGATANLMMAATLARGRTRLRNAAREPEIVALAAFLNKMGGQVRGAGTDSVEIEGVRALHPATNRAISDRIEAGTFLVAAKATGGNVTVKGCEPEHLNAILQKLSECGADLQVKEDSVRVEANGLRKGITITTSPYPGFPTDMQAQFMALLSLARGSSVIRETIYPDRFTHVAELERLGARIEVKEGNASIQGVRSLSGAHVMATDLRASAALVIAGLMARGKTHLHRIYHIDRGYERIEEKFRSIGAKIERVQDELPY